MAGLKAAEATREQQQQDLDDPTTTFFNKTDVYDNEDR